MANNDDAFPFRYKKAAEEIFAAPDFDQELVKASFWQLMTQSRACIARIGRWCIFGAFAVIVFELLNRKIVNNASISFIQVSHLAFVSYLLPPFVSLVFLNIVALAVESNAYDYMAAALGARLSPELAKTGVIGLIFSHGYFNADIPQSLAGPRTYLASQTFMSVQFLTVPILYIAFEIYAYFQLFLHLGGWDGFIYLSLTVSVFLLIVSILFIRGFLADELDLK